MRQFSRLGRSVHLSTTWKTKSRVRERRAKESGKRGGRGRWSGGFDRERIRTANKLDSGTQRSLHLDSFHETQQSETFEREWERRGGGGEIRLRIIDISLVLNPGKSFVSALSFGKKKKERKKKRTTRIRTMKQSPFSTLSTYFNRFNFNRCYYRRRPIFEAISIEPIENRSLLPRSFCTKN